MTSSKPIECCNLYNRAREGICNAMFDESIHGKILHYVLRKLADRNAIDKEAKDIVNGFRMELLTVYFQLLTTHEHYNCEVESRFRRVSRWVWPGRGDY